MQTSKPSKFLLSLQKNKTGIPLMLLSSVLVSFGQFVWKLSGGKDIATIILGIALYGSASLLMIVAFRYGSFSVLHPILSMNYVLGVTLGVIGFHEIITPWQIVGIAIILTGVTLIGVGDD